MALSPGTVLQNRYRIAKLVGQGGFGAVYRGWDIALEQPVAVKENFDSGPESQRQFEREAKLLAGLRHPNLPRVGDHFSVPGQGQYLVMDYVEGKSLAVLLAERGGPLSEAEAVPWVRQVCDALTYLHTRTPPIIHRDIKPCLLYTSKEDTAIGVIFAGFFALGVAMLSAGASTIDLAHFLFGNLLGVSSGDLWLTAGLGGLVLATIFLFYKEFLVLSFDPLLAATLRLPTTFLHYLLLLLIAVTIVVALQVVGVSLMLAILVTPAATASFVTHRLPTMMAVAALIGVVSGVAGVYAGYYLNIASGPAVVLAATSIFQMCIRDSHQPHWRRRGPRRRPGHHSDDVDAAGARPAQLSASGG